MYKYIIVDSVHHVVCVCVRACVCAATCIYMYSLSLLDSYNRTVSLCVCVAYLYNTTQFSGSGISMGS